MLGRLVAAERKGHICGEGIVGLEVVFADQQLQQPFGQSPHRLDLE